MAALFAWCRAAAGPTAERVTTVDPLPDENILRACEYRLVLPAGERPVRAAWTIFERGQDSIHWYEDSEVRGFAKEHRLALVLAMHCRSKEREDMIVEPSAGAGRALFTALDRFAESERHPELKRAPLILLGWSGAASLVGRMAGYRPGRYLAGIEYAPGQYEPLGMDTIELTEEAIRAPQLIIANGADKVNGTDRPYAYFRKYFDRGAPWTFTVQNRTPHCCLQNARGLILEWLRGVLETRRSRWGKGEFGYFRPEYSDVRDEWKQPVFNASSAMLGRKQPGPGNGDLPAGWMPCEPFARTWVAFMERREPPAVWKP